MEFVGKIIAVLPMKKGTSRNGNEWSAQEYVIESHEQYPKKMSFEVFGTDRIAQFNIQAGEELTVSFDIDAHEWNGRWFNSIRAWKVDRTSAQSTTPVQPSASFGSAPITAAETPFNAAQNGADDLPF